MRDLVMSAPGKNALGIDLMDDQGVSTTSTATYFAQLAIGLFSTTNGPGQKVMPPASYGLKTARKVGARVKVVRRGW